MNTATVAATRAERVRECRELRDQGLLMREIGEQLGLAVSTVNSYLNDPDGSRDLARKRRGRCVDCGTAIRSDQVGRGNPARCVACSVEAQRVWTRERIIEAIRAWAVEHDGEPPTAKDWNATRRAKQGRPPRGSRFPPANVLQRVFGSWNAGIEAAGFAPRESFSKSGGPGSLDPAVLAESIRLREQGLTFEQIASRQGGITAAGVYQRLITAGVHKPKGRNIMAAPLKAEQILDREIERAQVRVDELRAKSDEAEQVLSRLRAAREALRS